MDDENPPPTPTGAPPAPGWYPVDLTADTILWAWLGRAVFSDPFYHDTLQRHRDAPRARTPLAVLGQPGGTVALPPAAFLFHASRCGSTLVSQMLAALPWCRCLSEPAPVDSLLTAILSGKLSAEEGLPLFRGLIHSLAQPQPGIRHAVIKFDSWHTPALPLVQQAFPGVPCWFIHRDPAAILRSHRRERGSQMVPGLRNLTPFGIRTDGIPPHDLDAYTLRVLHIIFSAAAEHIAAGRLYSLPATSLPEAIDASWLKRHGIAATKADLESMALRSLRHSKSPVISWQPEPEPGPDDTPGLADLRALWQRIAR